MTVQLELVTSLRAEPAVAFDLSLDVGAHASSMAQSRERIVGGRRSGVLREGESVTWRARHLGIPWTMTSEVTEWDRPHRFVDEQSRGPFRSFRHEHLFVVSEGGCEMTDRITLRAPLGPLSIVAERAVLARYMRRLIEARNTWLKAALEAG